MNKCCGLMIAVDVLHIDVIEQDDRDDCNEMTILLRLSQDAIRLPTNHDPSHFNTDEAYTLHASLDTGCIVITGQKPSGVFYGSVSLISLAQGN